MKNTGECASLLELFNWTKILNVLTRWNKITFYQNCGWLLWEDDASVTFNQEVIQTVLTISFQIVIVPEILFKHMYLITIFFKYNVTLCNLKISNLMAVNQCLRMG